MLSYSKPINFNSRRADRSGILGV